MSAGAHGPTRAAVLAHGTGTDALTLHVGLAALTVTVAVVGSLLVAREEYGRWRAAAWVLSVAALCAALAPPVETAAARWLSVHMVQHVVLLVLVAPLVAASGVVRRAAAVLGPARTRLQPGVRAAPASVPALVLATAALHVAVLTGWHVPVLHELALARDAVHVVEHVSLLLVGFGYWAACTAAVRSRDRSHIGAALLATAVVTGSGLALGLLMAFAAAPWYDSYPASAGLAPLADQQTAGLVMSGTGGPVYLAVTAWLVATVLSTGELSTGERGRC